MSRHDSTGDRVVRSCTSAVVLCLALGCDGAGLGSPAARESPSDVGAPPVLASPDGVLSQLLFACVGDTRAPAEDDAQDYPSDVISALYADIEAWIPRPPLVVSTGDYMYASQSNGAEVTAQLDLYMQARSRYSGALVPAMGNHECNGETIANCGPGSLGGLTANYTEFVERMLGPIGQVDPYYVVRVGAVDRSWTAKFVIVAANAWSSTQQTWLEATLAQPTTYTFVVRHEPAAVTEAPGVDPSESIMTRYPYTLALVGHDHTYRHSSDRPREVVIGNGGAPLSSKDYGFGLFSQRSDGAIVVDMVNWRTQETDAAFHFVVRPDGTVL